MTTSCENRIDSHLQSRLEDLRLMLQPTADDIELIDDGTLDTVIGIPSIDIEFRYQDIGEGYRDPKTGAWLDGAWDDFLEESGASDDVLEAAYERFFEYGLFFDYVAPDTFENQPEGYFRYQISWGGPSDEFRIYVNVGSLSDPSIHRIEYWFLDWFDGASRDVTSSPIAQHVAQWFADVGAFDSAYREAAA